jgi:uncharacterized protein (DUF4415 family)
MTLREALASEGLTDWDRLHREEAEGVEPAEDDPEDAFDWTNAVVLQRPGKAALSIRLDEDVVAFFRDGGPGYQTRINAVLRAYVEAQRKR